MSKVICPRLWVRQLKGVALSTLHLIPLIELLCRPSICMSFNLINSESHARRSILHTHTHTHTHNFCIFWKLRFWNTRWLAHGHSSHFLAYTAPQQLQLSCLLYVRKDLGFFSSCKKEKPFHRQVPKESRSRNTLEFSLVMMMMMELMPYIWVAILIIFSAYLYLLSCLHTMFLWVAIENGLFTPFG